MNDDPESQRLSTAIARMERGKNKPFAICHHLAEKVADLMQRDPVPAECCLDFVTDTYEFTPCKAVKLAIENCFLFHLGTRIFNCPQRSKLLKLLTLTLRELLMCQMMASGL